MDGPPRRAVRVRHFRLDFLRLRFAVLVILGFSQPSLWAAFGDEPTLLHNSKTDGQFEAGWTVQIPTGSSDFLHVRYDAPIDITLEGVSVSVADFGTSLTFPSVGVYPSNLLLDPAGSTPDLTLPWASLVDPVLSGGPLFEVCDYLFPPVTLLGGEPYHVAAQLPPADMGMLGIGADTDLDARGGDEPPGSPNPFDSSYFSSDAYTTPALSLLSGELGLGTLASPCDHITLSPGETILRCVTECGDFVGDYETVSVQAGDPFGFYAVGEQMPGLPTFGLVMFSLDGVPLRPFGPAAPFIPLEDDCSSYFRACGTWPCGVGNVTLTFVEVTGIGGVPGSVRVSNEVTIHSLPDPDPAFGPLDDGTFESSWVVQNPAGSSDYFSTRFSNALPGENFVCGMSVAPMDFGTSETAFPRMGFAPPELTVDPSGMTPDLANPYLDNPLPFPPLTFVTTADQMISVSIALLRPAGDAIGFLQMPVGDIGFLSIGADSDGASSGESGFSFDGFATPANPIFLNWGIRLQ